MSPIEAASVSTHPLRVPNLETRFEVSGYTIREWAKAGRLRGARKIGREWRFPVDVDYVDEPKPLSVAEQVQAALAGLRAYEVGKPRLG
jgi:hypothetical protein